MRKNKTDLVSRQIEVKNDTFKQSLGDNSLYYYLNVSIANCKRLRFFEENGKLTAYCETDSTLGYCEVFS